MLIEIKIELGMMVHLGGRGQPWRQSGADAVPGKQSPLCSTTAVALDVLLIIWTSGNVFSRCRNHIDISGSIVRNSENLENT